MKKCAKCDAEYEDAYDGCPACAQGQGAAPRHAPVDASVPSGIEVISLIVALLCIGMGLLLYFGGSHDLAVAIRWIGAGFIVGVFGRVARELREGKK